MNGNRGVLATHLTMPSCGLTGRAEVVARRDAVVRIDIWHIFEVGGMPTHQP